MYIEQWYGGYKIHIKELNINMNFDTLEEAQEFKNIWSKIKDLFQQKIKILQSRIDELQQKLNEEIAKNTGFIY